MIFSLKKVHKFLYSFFHTFRFCPLPSVLLNTLMTPFRALICVQVFVRTPRSFNLKLQLRKIIYYSCYRSFFIHLNSISTLHYTLYIKQTHSICPKTAVWMSPVCGNISTKYLSSGTYQPVNTGNKDSCSHRYHQPQ